MAFTKPTQQTPVAIGKIKIVIDDEAGIPGAIKSETSIEVKDANGMPIYTWTGNLASHLSTAQKNGITSLLAAIRTKAQTELI